MKNPQFSVIIPTFNEEKFVGKLLESLSIQTVKNFEVIVADSLSKDKTVKVVESFRHKLPSLTIFSSKKASQSVQRNLGATVARADWLAFIDADSILMPYFFERVNQFINTHNPSIMTTWFEPDSELTADAILILFLMVSIEGSRLISRPIAPGGLTLIHKKAFQKVGGYNEKLRYGEDYDITKRIVDQGFKYQTLRETLWIWSLRRNRKEGNLKTFQKNAIAILSIFLINRPPRSLPGYELGGAYFKTVKNRVRLTSLRKYSKSFQDFLREFLSI